MFLVDADFITSLGARAALVDRLRLTRGQRKVLVVPAFDVNGGGKEVPRDKSRLKESGAVAVQLAKSECAHKATQYNRWWSSSDPFVVTAAEWNTEDFCYEPYFVAPAGIAKFDQRCAGCSSIAANCYGFALLLRPSPADGASGSLLTVGTKLPRRLQSGPMALSLKFSPLFLLCM